MLPAFDARTGALPLGIHPATWDALADRFGWNGHRRRLLAGLREAMLLLRAAGCRRVYVDGSFATDKELPVDIDALWDTAGVDEDALDPVFFAMTDHRRAQKARFRCEFFGVDWIADAEGRPFIEFFQADREGTPKGIVAVALDTVV